MLTLSAAGKSISDVEKLIADARDEQELRILIESPAQAEEITQLLKAEGFNDFVPEDDDGLLYLAATRREPPAKPEPALTPAPVPAAIVQGTTGVVLSYEAGKYMPAFAQKFIASLLKAKSRPVVLALMNSAVTLAAYNSGACGDIKRLEAEGVRVMVSEACADRAGITEALGAGGLAEMPEIIDVLMSCEKVISL
ncbi:MAG: hypothetical protein IJT02_04490 [Synergistaceae bacterium]|nr:hypothetical protein [Synergistaceae bacterium]